MYVSAVRHMLPLAPLLLALTACGKKMETSEGAINDVQGVELPGTFQMTATYDSSQPAPYKSVYSIPRDGDVTLPARIPLDVGDTGIHSLKIVMNRDGDDWEFHCTYKGNVAIPGSAPAYVLQKCQDPDGTDMGLTAANISLFPFPIDQGKKIELVLTPSGTPVAYGVRAVIHADWK